MLSSELRPIPGVGPATAKALLSSFKTMKAIRSAEIDEIAAVKGVSRPTAEKIYKFYHDVTK